MRLLGVDVCCASKEDAMHLEKKVRTIIRDRNSARKDAKASYANGLHDGALYVADELCKELAVARSNENKVAPAPVGLLSVISAGIGAYER